MQICLHTVIQSNTESYTGDQTKGVFVWSPQVVPVNQAHLPYQRVNTATDYDADPVKFPPYLIFDGVDDYLVTNSIDFTATDKMTVMAGVRKLSDAAAGMVAELSASVAANTGVFALTAPASAGPNIGFSSKGATEAGNVATGVPAPATQVIAGLASIDPPLNRLRINQVTAETTASQGTGNYGNFPLYIGRRGGTSLPFNGNLYGLIVRGAATDDLHLTNAEKFLAYKSGVTL